MKTLIAIVLLTLSSFSFITDAEDCSTGGCNSSSNLGQNQSQSDYNTLTQAPAMTLSGSNSNSVINSNVTAGQSTSISADGGLSISGNCPTDTFYITGGMGNNYVTTDPNDYSSNSVNANVQLGYVSNFGEAKDLCIEGQRVGVQAQKLAFSKLLITTCITFINSGLDIYALAKIDKQYELCPKIAQQAIEGYHGRVAAQAVEKYRKEREANMRKLGIDPKQEHQIYYK